MICRVGIVLHGCRFLTRDSHVADVDIRGCPHCWTSSHRHQDQHVPRHPEQDYGLHHGDSFSANYFLDIINIYSWHTLLLWVFINSPIFEAWALSIPKQIRSPERIKRKEVFRSYFQRLKDGSHSLHRSTQCKVGLQASSPGGLQTFLAPLKIPIKLL